MLNSISCDLLTASKQLPSKRMSNVRLNKAEHKKYSMKKIKFHLLISLILVLSACSNPSNSDTDSDTDPPTDEKTESTTGTLEITTVTEGNSADEDGYTLTVGDLDSQPIDSDDTVTIADLEEGSYSVELSELAEFCAVEGDNPVSVDITADETTSVDFKIICTQSSAKGTIVFIERVDQSTEQLFTMDTDGSNKTKVGDGITGDSPNLSPDGSKIVYAADNAIWVVDLDGSNARKLTHPDEFYGDGSPAWSPDGSQIVYESDAGANYTNSEIYIMDADGTNKTQLTNHEAEDENPSWSPDGNQIVFSSDRDGDDSAELHSIDVSSGEVSLLLEPTDDNGINLGDPEWSPDGSSIAYQGYTTRGHLRIFIVDADGENADYITSNDFAARQPTWSPDGEYIAFMNLSDGSKTNAIWTIKKDGSQATKLTDDADTYSSDPSWGPAAE